MWKSHTKLHSSKCVCVRACVRACMYVCVCVCQRKTKDRADGIREKSARYPRRDSNLYLWDTCPSCFRLHHEGRHTSRQSKHLRVCVFVCVSVIINLLWLRNCFPQHYAGTTLISIAKLDLQLQTMSSSNHWRRPISDEYTKLMAGSNNPLLLSSLIASADN